MVKVNRINTSQIEGGYSDDTDKRPNGEMALYNDYNGSFDLVIHDGINSTSLNKVLGKGKLYGHGADSADGNGYDTIKLIPDIPAYTNGSHQYLIIDPTGPNHVHLRAGGNIDDSNSELVIGGEHSYVKIGSGQNPPVYIKSNDYNWTFNTNGEFIAPNGATIGPMGEGFPAFYNSQVNNPVVVLNRDIDSGADLAALTLQPAVSLESGGLATMVVAGTGTGSYEYWHFKHNGVLELASNGIKFSDNTTQTTAWTGNISSAQVSDFNSSVSGLLPVTSITAGTGISISSLSGNYTINATGTGTGEAALIKTTVFNQTGNPIPKFTVVYINGGQGDQPTVALAVASGEMTSSKTYGITSELINNMSTGGVIIIGALTGLNTDQFNPTAPTGNVNGTTLWLSPTTPGGVTTTKPSAPNHAVAVGTIVRTHQNQGVVEVRIQNGYELEELHNVSISGVAHNQSLVYNSGTALWTNQSINSTILGDYSTNTFSPSFGGTGGNPIITYAIQYGHYIKIGKLVYFTIRIQNQNKTNAGLGDLTILNLPFTSSNTNAGYATGVVRHTDGIFGTAATSFYISPNTSYISLMNDGSNISVNSIGSTSQMVLNGFYVTDS